MYIKYKKEKKKKKKFNKINLFFYGLGLGWESQVIPEFSNQNYSSYVDLCDYFCKNLCDYWICKNMRANEFRYVWLVRKGRKREENKFFF